MRVTVNDRPLQLDAGITVQGLLEALGVAPQKVAVEVNLEIIPREDYGSRQLCDGDRVELITFVGGG